MDRNIWLLTILLESLNAISYALASVLCIREYRVRKTRWGGGTYCALIVDYAVIYLNLLAWEAASITGGSKVMNVVDLVASTLIGPLLLHAFYNGERRYLPAPLVWKTWLGLSYLIALGGVVGGGAVTLGLARNPLPVKTELMANLWLEGQIVLAATGVIALLLSSRRLANGPVARRQRLWVASLVAVWACLAVLWLATRLPACRVLKDLCPLVFVCVVTYYVERLAFFDVLIKKGALAAFSLFLLAVYFVWLTPWMARYRLGALLWSLSVWPIVLLNPWLQRRLSAWLDRLWLGRRFSPIEASEHFLDGLQGAIGERELAGLAQRRLCAIFQSEAEVLLDPSPPPAKDGESMQAPVKLGTELVGVIRVRPRAHNPRFLSEDVALLGSLAEIFSFLLENLRLREKRLEQEQRERELVLNANRSELKALRAQVNPHFLFNALNTIASLIPRHPDRAEQTIEQLAEVFRYTLRRSDREWVTLDEELEAVRAYLDIEQARFGDRLAVRIEAGEEARQARIPAMIVQTLVENAVKHGVGAIRTRAVVEITAGATAAGLSIEVRDNGPGFPAAEMRAAAPGNGGFGLRNVRERLQGHFGDAAGLSIDRDSALGITVVGIRLPRAAEARAR